jgi:hypothetical protein
LSHITQGQYTEILVVALEPLIKDIICKLLPQQIELMSKSDNAVTDELNGKVVELELSYKTVCDELSVMKTAMVEIQEELDMLKKEVSHMKSEQVVLANANQATTIKAEKLQQYSYQYNCLLHGIPERADENTYKIVEDKLIHMNLENCIDDIEITHRLGKQRENPRFPRPIVFKLLRRPTKDLIIKTYTNLTKEYGKLEFAFSSHLPPFIYQQKINAKYNS